MGRRSRSRSEDYSRSSRSRRHRSRSYSSRRDRDHRSRHHSNSRSRSRSRESERGRRKGMFDVKPEGIPGEMLNNAGTLGVMSKMLNPQSTQSKVIRRLIVTNLPKDGEDTKLKDFLCDIINKCVDQEIPQPPITSLISHKEQGNAIIELQTPELATACLIMDGIPYEGCSIGIVRPTDFNPADVPPPQGRPPRLHMDKVGFTPKLGAREIASAVSSGSENEGKIFIGEIPLELSENQLIDLFTPFGKVKSFTISRDPNTNESRGFGYLQYEDASIVSAVCESMNGVKVMDQSLVIRPAVVKQTQTVVMAGDEQVELDPSLVTQATLDLPDLKTPFIAESNKARDAAAKLLKQAGISTGGQIQKSPPSRIIVLKNMVTREDLENADDYLDIKADIEAECSRFGQVLSIVIPRGENPGVGNVIVEYPNIQQAASAAVSLIGRKFNKHIIRASFMSETAYANKKYNVYKYLLQQTKRRAQLV